MFRVIRRADLPDTHADHVIEAASRSLSPRWKTGRRSGDALVGRRDRSVPPALESDRPAQLLEPQRVLPPPVADGPGSITDQISPRQPIGICGG